MSVHPTYTKARAVTKSDSTVLNCSAFVAGGAGNVAILAEGDSSAVTITAVIVGQVYPIRCQKIMSTNTTATNIVALY